MLPLPRFCPLLILLFLFAPCPAFAQQATLASDASAPAKTQELDCPATLDVRDTFTFASGIVNNGANAVQGVFLDATSTEQLALDSLRTSFGVWTQQDDQNARLDIGTLPGNTRVDFEIDLLGVAGGEATFELTLGQAGGQDQTDSCTIAVFRDVVLEGDLEVTAVQPLTIDPFIALHFTQDNATLVLNDGAEINGEGVFVFAGTNQTLFLGDRTHAASKASGSIATIENLRLDTGSTVTVEDDDPAAASDLFITNRLDVDDGLVDLNDNNVWIVGPTNDGHPGGVHIEDGAAIQGAGTFFIAVDPAALGGPPNTRQDAYRITGEGALNVAFDKNTDAGVVMELSEVGGGGFSFNRAGALFVTGATRLNGSFRNMGAARTEFDALQTITTSLEVVGPGGEMFPADGECDGNESGVYFFSPVTVGDDLLLDDSDDPVTACQVEGVSFLADKLDPGATVFSTIEGNFTSDHVTGLFLDFDNPPFAFHNVAFQGDLLFDEAPIFLLNAPANAFPVGHLDAPYTIEALGNKVRFSGDNDQQLVYTDALKIASVQIDKDNVFASVEIAAPAVPFLIDTSLEIIRGRFITNGLLDAEGTATVVLNRDLSGNGDPADNFGTLQRGITAARTYLSDDPGDGPRKVKYTGNSLSLSGDEIPGPAEGSAGGAEIFLPALELFMSDENAGIILEKDFTVGRPGKDGGALIITRGRLDLGSSVIRLANTLTVAIGDGTIRRRSGFDFPTQWIPNPAPDGFGRAFRAGEDGIDLLFFGTTDHTVGLEWPAAETSVQDAYEDPDVIRNVTIDPAQNGNGEKVASPQNITVSLREEDDVYRINGVLVVAAGSALDPAGNVLEGGQTFFLQVIHNAPGAGPLDISINGARALDDLAFRTASAYLPFPAGQTTLTITNGDGSTTFDEGTVTLPAGQSYILFLHGLVNGNPAFEGLLLETRQEANDTAQVEFRFVQGAPDAATLDLRLLDPDNSNMPVGSLANDQDFNQRTDYLGLPPDTYNMEVSTADNSVQFGVWRFDLSGREGQTFALLGSGLFGDNSFTLIGFDADGAPILPTLVTRTEADAGLPETFALHGNYPNPFNPTTTIAFDLPETARVHVEIIDLLGRQVLTGPPKPFEAGAGRRLAVHASALASGLYFYRVVARTATNTIIETGRMVLMK